MRTGTSCSAFRRERSRMTVVSRLFLWTACVAMACGGGPASPDPPAASAAASRVLVVTHTTGFRHSSIPIAEATIEQLGRTSGAFTTAFCRTADDVRRMLTTAGLADVDAVVFANTT